jgi:hypothetical protein
MESTHTPTHYAYGWNMPGYLPDPDVVHIVSTFDEAKRRLIHEMLFSADYASTEDAAENYTNAAEDINLWSGPDSLTVAGEAWWVMATDQPTDDEDNADVREVSSS